MSESLLQFIQIDNYARLLRNLVGNVNSIVVYAVDAQTLWNYGEPVDRRPTNDGIHIDEMGRGSGSETSNIQVKNLENRQVVYSLFITDAQERLAGTIDIWAGPGESANRDVQQESKTTDAIHSLADCITNEYRLAKELAFMADELSERYEELNLVYQTDESIHDDTNGYQIIRQMIRSYIDYLDIGMIALLLPESDIELFETKTNNKMAERHRLLSILQNELFPLVKKGRQSIVVNSIIDATRLELPAIPYKFIAVPISNEEKETIGIVAIFNGLEKNDFSNGDRNLLAAMGNKLTRVVLSRFDPLTGLNNLRNFELYLKKALHLSHYNGDAYSILSIDIDQLHIINDLGGRKAGDRLLYEIGKKIHSQVRDQDIIARIGGDEFAVLLKNCTMDVAKKIATSLQKYISATPFLWNHKRYDITTTIGMAPVNGDIDSTSNVLSAAEMARDTAKERGRNKLHIFKPEDSHIRERTEQMQWMSRIQVALREDHFMMFAQPIVPLDPSDPMIHFETLLRLRCDDEGGKIIAPGAFMGAAENFYLMPEIDRWVVRKVLSTIAYHWSRLDTSNVLFSVNLSGQSICDDGFQDFLLQELDNTPIPASTICFEITETAAIANLAEARSLIYSLKRLGCSFSLDDFGTGLSSFSYLQNLDIEYLKIDGSFVKDITTNKVSKSMVSAINQVGHAMNLRTIAEWVEDAETAKCLRALGIDYGQGFGLGRPEPLETQLQKLHDLDKQMAGELG